MLTFFLILIFFSIFVKFLIKPEEHTRSSTSSPHRPCNPLDHRIEGTLVGILYHLEYRPMALVLVDPVIQRFN